MGAQNIANGSASLEPDFSANTINTTWYSNGTQLTGNNIPATCTYDDALTPPTPENRPGYVFAGWSVRTVNQCSLTSVNFATNGQVISATNSHWAVEFPYGTVSGSAACIDDDAYQEISPYASVQECNMWMNKCGCRIETYTPNGGEQCELISYWLSLGSGMIGMNPDDAECTSECAYYVATTQEVREIMFPAIRDDNGE